MRNFAQFLCKLLQFREKGFLLFLSPCLKNNQFSEELQIAPFEHFQSTKLDDRLIFPDGAVVVVDVVVIAGVVVVVVVLLASRL